ncbi:RHS repeat-associated core domain-containing protein [Pseudidiomarina sp. PP-1MA]|uniref:RHS repeat-associated core domain-containing protein n=1 Tax=Pseudidiomarina sp. PP-1MA TaxID=3237706 RepID=A0AB39XB07_9GAMM
MIDGTLMEPGARPRLKNFADYAGISNIGITRRGFTDHLHLDDVELIHMNGRVYDYNLGRFLSVDPVIQSPGNSQSLNPYSYLMNNPLAGTDPTGYSGCGVSQMADSMCPHMTALENATTDTSSKPRQNDSASNTVGNGAQPSELTDLVQRMQVADIGSQNQAPALGYVLSDSQNDKSPTDISNDVYTNINFKGKIKTTVDVKNKAYTLQIKLSVGTNDIEHELLSDYIAGINEHFNIEGTHSNGYKILLKTDVSFSKENPDFYINECPGWCSTANSFRNAGRASLGSTLIELRAPAADRNTAEHEFGHMLGLLHQHNDTKSLLSYAHVEGHERKLTDNDLQRLFQQYRKDGYE